MCRRRLTSKLPRVAFWADVAQWVKTCIFFSEKKVFHFEIWQKSATGKEFSHHGCFCRMRQIYCSLLAMQTRLTVVHYAKFLFLCSCKLNYFLILISHQHHCHLLSWTGHVRCHGTVCNPRGISAKFFMCMSSS